MQACQKIESRVVARLFCCAAICKLTDSRQSEPHAHCNSEWGITTFLALRVPLRIAAGTIGILNVRCNLGAERWC
jgi:hypothetical protein